MISSPRTEMGRTLLLLLCLTFAGTPAAYQADMTVTQVQSGIVTLSDGEREWEIDEAEAWRVGDRGRAIVLTNGTESTEDDTIAYIEYVWEGR